MSNWAVLFDWDGVVIDSSLLHEKSWEIVVEEYSFPLWVILRPALVREMKL